MQEFQNALREAIAESGMSMMRIAKALRIPYRTMQDWRAGRRVPNEFQQNAVLKEIRNLDNTEKENKKVESIVRLIRHSTVAQIRGVRISHTEAAIKAAVAAVDEDPDIVAQFPTWEAAQTALRKLSSEITEERGAVGERIRATQYEIEELAIDEDGDIDYNDVLRSERTALPTEVVMDGCIFRKVGFGEWRGEWLVETEDDEA